LRKSLKEEILTIEENIIFNYGIDENKIKLAELELENHKIKMTDALKKIVSPDALLVLIEELLNEYESTSKKQSFSMFSYRYSDEKNKKLENYQFINDLRSELKLFDTGYYKSLMSTTSLLMACSFGYPCNDFSEYIVNICLGYEVSYSKAYDNSMAIEACGQTVQDYIINHQLTTNQLLDANALMSIMVDTHE